MMKLTLLPMLLCLTTLPVISGACNGQNCTQSCLPESTSCQTFDCGKATQKCKQFCIGPSIPCNTLTCSEKQASCAQDCKNCPKNTKLTCSSATCTQNCDGENCDMVCTKGVKICNQICAPNSKCRMVCHNSTDCRRSCGTGANCTYPASGPPTPSPVTTNCGQDRCVVKCERSCKGRTLSCPAANTKPCELLCKDGCNMVCGETLEKCTMNCTGDVTNCKRSCKAKACIVYLNGKLVQPVSGAGTLFYRPIFCGFLLVLLARSW